MTTRTSYIWPLLHWTRPACLLINFYSASSLKWKSVGRHVDPIGHIIQIPSQPVFTLTHFNLTWLGLEPTIYYTRGKHTTHYTTEAIDYRFWDIIKPTYICLLKECTMYMLIEVKFHNSMQLTFHFSAHFLVNSANTTFSEGCFFLCSSLHVCTKKAYEDIRPRGFPSALAFPIML